jgi:organic radical activating enzyme
MNKSYCKRAFDHIYCDNKGRYRLCCHAYPFEDKPIFNSTVTTPFKYYLSPEMDEVRKKMLNGEDIPQCGLCTSMESGHISEWGENSRQTSCIIGPKTKENLISDVGISYREFNKIQTEPRDIELKLRVFGSHCNLSCYMCHPHNSSTRRKEISLLKNNYFGGNDKPIKKEQYDKTIKDVLDNIDRVSSIKFTGGEPFLLPRMWSFLNKISDEDASKIKVSFDTNLTAMDYTKFTSDIVLKFKEVTLAVSCDHYGDKLAWIRYPIDVKKFESNLKLYREWINFLHCTASILNINDYDDIIKYYKDHFDLKLKFCSIVYGPSFLTPRNSNNKKELIESFKDNEIILAKELENEPHESDQEKMKQYLSELNDIRKIDVFELWPNLDIL